MGTSWAYELKQGRWELCLQQVALPYRFMTSGLLHVCNGAFGGANSNWMVMAVPNGCAMCSMGSRHIFPRVRRGVHGLLKKMLFSSYVEFIRCLAHVVPHELQGNFSVVDHHTARR